MPTITKTGPFNKLGNLGGNLVSGNYGDVEKNTMIRSLGNGKYAVNLEYSAAVDGVLAASGGTRSFRIAGTPTVFTLPLGAQIMRADLKVDQTFTSTTDAATLGIEIPVDDVAGIVALIAISNVANTWDQAAKVKATIQDGSVANASEVTTVADRVIQLRNSHASEPTINGACKLYVEYYDLA